MPTMIKLRLLIVTSKYTLIHRQRIVIYIILKLKLTDQLLKYFIILLNIGDARDFLGCILSGQFAIAVIR